jgi:DNA-binding response OmpR family regulator
MDSVKTLKNWIGLSRTEAGLFDCLVAHADNIVPRSILLDTLKGRSPRTVDSHIMEIRRKMERHQVQDVTIETVKGCGFVLRTKANSK